MCQTNNSHELENGLKDSDIRPKYRGSPAPSRNGLYMDEAVSKTKFGLFNCILIFVSGMTLYAAVVETVGITFVIPVSECDLNLTTSEKGVLVAAGFAGIICSSHLWGFLADTKGRRRVIHPTLFIAFLLSVASSFAQNFYLFATLRFLNGFFISGCSATIYAYLSEFHNNAQRGRAIMGSTVIYAVSCTSLPLIAWSVINQDWQFDVPLIGITYKPWRLFLVVCALPGLLSFIILSFLPESPKFVLGQGNHAEAHRILQKLNRVNNGRNAILEEFKIYEEPESVENRRRIEDSKSGRFPFLSSIWSQTAPLFKPPYLMPTLLICSIQFLLFSTCYGLYMFSADILNRMSQNLDDLTNQRAMMCDAINMKLNVTDVSPSEICTTKLELETMGQGVILEALNVIFSLVIGLTINKIGIFPILFVSIVLPGLSGIVCMLTDIPLLQISAFIGLLLSCIGANLMNVATVEIYPTSLRAMAVCMSLMFGRLGSVVGANTAALLLDNHCETVFYLSGSSLIGAGILSLLLSKVHRALAKPENMPIGPRVSVLSMR